MALDLTETNALLVADHGEACTYNPGSEALTAVVTAGPGDGQEDRRSGAYQLLLGEAMWLATAKAASVVNFNDTLTDAAGNVWYIKDCAARHGIVYATISNEQRLQVGPL